jgi:hypothetical protein
VGSGKSSGELKGSLAHMHRGIHSIRRVWLRLQRSCKKEQQENSSIELNSMSAHKHRRHHKSACGCDLWGFIAEWKLGKQRQ